MPDRFYIRASDVGTFVFCRLAWHLSQAGAPSAREPERFAGTIFHAQHDQRVTAAARTGRFAQWCLVAAVLLLLAALGLAFL